MEQKRYMSLRNLSFMLCMMLGGFVMQVHAIKNEDGASNGKPPVRPVVPGAVAASGNLAPELMRVLQMLDKGEQGVEEAISKLNGDQQAVVALYQMMSLSEMQHNMQQEELRDRIALLKQGNTGQAAEIGFLKAYQHAPAALVPLHLFINKDRVEEAQASNRLFHKVSMAYCDTLDKGDQYKKDLNQHFGECDKNITKGFNSQWLASYLTTPGAAKLEKDFFEFILGEAVAKDFREEAAREDITNPKQLATLIDGLVAKHAPQVKQKVTELKDKYVLVTPAQAQVIYNSMSGGAALRAAPIIQAALQRVAENNNKK